MRTTYNCDNPNCLCNQPHGTTATPANNPNVLSVTERDAVLRERGAFAKGYATQICKGNPEAIARYAGLTTYCQKDGEAAARIVYPLPRVTRPRVVSCDDGWEFCFLNTRADALLMARRVGNNGWMNDSDTSYPTMTWMRYKQLAGLFANPTETVEDSE